MNEILLFAFGALVFFVSTAATTAGILLERHEELEEERGAIDRDDHDAEHDDPTDDIHLRPVTNKETA